jgi:predicted nucleic acid-binding protein
MPKTKPRPFVDTNVFFSAFYRPGSPPEAILTHPIHGTITIVISRQVLEELVATLREKQPHLVPTLQAFLTNAPPEVCSEPTAEEVHQATQWINRDDAPILAAAKKSGADCVVTGNTRHFTTEVAKRAGIAIFNPAQYLTLLEQSGDTRPPARS